MSCLVRLCAAALVGALVLGVLAAAPAQAGTAPWVLSAVVDGADLTVRFSDPMQGDFDTDDWTYAVDGVDQGHPELVEWDGGWGRAELTVSVPVAFDQEVTLSYTPGAAPLLRDTAGDLLAGFTGLAVQNDTPAPPPVVVTLDLSELTEEARTLARDVDSNPPPANSPPPRNAPPAQIWAAPPSSPPPPSVPLLHGNEESADAQSFGDKTKDHAQSFTTGSHRWGYALTSVAFDICFNQNIFESQWNTFCLDRPADAPDDPTYEISLWTARRVPADGNTSPGYYVPHTKVTTFAKANDDPLTRTPAPDVLVGCGGGVCTFKPGTPDTEVNSFNVPGPPGSFVLLDPDTTYVLVVDFISTTGSSNPKLVRTGQGRNSQDSVGGWLIQTKTEQKCLYPGEGRVKCRPGDLAPWERMHAHLTRDSNSQDPGDWQYGASRRLGHTYRIQVDGYVFRPPLLRDLGDEYAQVGSQHPGGCGGTPMPFMSREERDLSFHYYCHVSSGTWVQGRWPSPCDDDHPYRSEQTYTDNNGVLKDKCTGKEL